MKKMKFSALLLFFSIAITAISLVDADAIQGCGGFVEASSSLIKSRKPSDSKLDYSNITVELLTVDGLIKERTQCAPNGYYFIPVYDKGSFVMKIKGPEGWSWDPENVSVVIDQNGCNNNADINFRFTGFTLSGRVLGAVGGETCLLKYGPSNVKIELLSEKDDLVSSVFTSPMGSYLFTNIIPGTYKLRASHPKLNVEVRGPPEVELGFGNGIVDDIFFVPGYDIHGSVVAQGNPILGVHIYLYSDDVLEVTCPQGSGDAPWPKRALCHAISDADGKFTFNSIPCGTYELLPFYKGENTVFDVSPPSMNVSVGHHHLTVAQKFQVTGFSVGGRVVDGNGVGVDGVKILLDDQQRSITDGKGYYKLDQVTSKRYTISAEKDHYKFISLENLLVLPNMASVADIKAAYYDICGVVRLTSADYKAKVTLTHGPENVKPQVKLTDENGNFCFEVPPGEYRLSALAGTSESAPGLLFLPPHIDVTVNKPLLHVEFSQALVDIHGTAVCKEKCGPSVSISLSPLVGKNRKKRSTVSLTDGSNNFVFPKVLPGKYLLEVKHDSLETTEDNWCWEQSAIEVDVGTEDLKGITFVQKGYWISIISSHDVDSNIHQPDGEVVNLQIKRGSQQICMESPGAHELYFVNSCVFFGSPSMKFDTLKPLPIYLTGKKYLLKGTVQLYSRLHQHNSGFPETIVIDIFDGNKAVLDVIHAKLVSNERDQSGLLVFEYSMFANLGDELILAPYDSRDGERKKFLFYPRQHRVSVSTDGCQAPIPPFIGRVGLYIEGSVSPALAGVDIKVIAAGDSNNAPLQKGDVALETKTGADGSYVGGPLYDDTIYHVEASKAGYCLKPVGSNSFSCQKLSQISIRIFAGDNVENILPSVLLSLSGEDGYRNNSVTGASGSFLFDYLLPGSFYLRPLLKEYSFSPPAQAIELGSGESKEVVFHATRVAYSAMGTVSLLSGQAAEAIAIEARSDSKGYYEETVTDSSGNYRLRGLLPDTTYLIRVKEDFGSIKVERASPEIVSVMVGFEDIKGLDFVVFEQPEMTIISGHVEGIGLDELQPHLSVEIRLADDPSRIESVFPLPLSYFFQIRDLPKAKHLVQLKSGFSSSMKKFESEIIEIDLEKQSQVHVGPLRYKVEDLQHKLEPTPAPVFPLVVGVSVIALFISMPRLKDVYQLIVGVNPLGSTISVKKEARKPAVRKRA